MTGKVGQTELQDQFATQTESLRPVAFTKSKWVHFASNEPHYPRKRPRHEIDDSVDKDICDVKLVQRLKGAEDFNATAPDKRSTPLEKLPAELLEIIAWKSLSPVLPLTSKTIFQKLGHLKKLRYDMALLIFCDWDEVHKDRDMNREDFPSDDLDLDTTKLPFRTLVAISSLPPTINAFDLRALRNMFGDSTWCNRPFLNNLASTVVNTWWNYCFQSDEIWPGSHNTTEHYFRVFGDTQPIVLQTTDLSHGVLLRPPYEARIICSNGEDSKPKCPQYGTGSCPKSLGIGLDSEYKFFPFQRIFALPRVPTPVLLENDNSDDVPHDLRMMEWYVKDHSSDFAPEAVRWRQQREEEESQTISADKMTVMNEYALRQANRAVYEKVGRIGDGARMDECKSM